MRRVAVTINRKSKEVTSRARKISKEVGGFWRRNEKEERVNIYFSFIHNLDYFKIK